MSRARHVSLLILAAVLTTLCACVSETAPAGFAMDFLATGKSDCVIVQMDGLVIVNDAADEDDYEQIVARLEKYEVQRIDYLILSHYDKDHIGSAARLVERYAVGTVLGPDYVEASPLYAALESACAVAETPWLRLTEDYVIETESGRVLADPPDVDYGDDNNNSLVTTVSYGENRFLLLGDAKKKRTEELLESAEADYTLMKLPHHGDSNKALLTLVERTSPEYAVEMVSQAEEVEPALREALCRAGTQLLLTRNGEITVRVTGGELQVKGVS